MADVAEEYRSSLAELNFNSKPHINMLTMLAEENLQHAPLIVKAIVDHIKSVTPDVKLPSLYLVDSIVKNVGQIYSTLFSKHLVELFTSVFEKVDEQIRSLLFKLRSTWTGIFPSSVLLDLDKSVTCLDPAWPVPQLSHKNIHVNPKFLDKPVVESPQKTEALTKSQCALLEVEMKKKQLELLKSLEEKKKKLLELRIQAGVDASKVEIQRKINTRDPRLAKKVAAATVTDSTTLQSVVVIPKGNAKKKNEKALSPVSKKIKLDDVHHSKVNLNQNLVHQDNNSNYTSDVQRDIKCKIKTDHETSNLCQPEFGKSEQLLKYPIELRSRSDDVGEKQISLTLNVSNKCVIEIPNSCTDSAFKAEPVHEEKYHYSLSSKKEAYDKKMPKLEPPPLPPLFFGGEDKDYRILPKNLEERNMNDVIGPKRVSLPVVKSLKLDNKERKVYFVNERSFAFMDDNTPRELTFEGVTQLVFIEGLPHPIELGFGEHEVKFEIDGKYHFIKFGTPTREVYIDDHPYEASFGGPPFTAVLENGKLYRIKISGPAPKVVLSSNPAYDLYERFCKINKEFLEKFDNGFSNEDPDTIHDVDMRVNKKPVISSFFNFPLEKMNDVNWQRIQVDNSHQTEWNVPKNSFETCKDINSNFNTQRNYSEVPNQNRSVPLTEVPNSALNLPPPLPPKLMINRFPGMPSATVSSTFTSLPQFYSECPRPPLPPNNGLFPLPMNSGGVFSVAAKSNETPAIPKLSPPPLPPFLNTIPNTSCMTVLPLPKDEIQTSVPYCNPAVSATLSLPHTPSTLSLTQTVAAMPPVNMTPMPMVRPAVSADLSNAIMTSQILTSTVPVQMSNIPVSVPITSSTSSTVLNSAPVNMNLILEELVAAGVIGKSSGNSTAATTAAVSSELEKKETVKKEEPLLKEDSVPENPMPKIVFEPKCLRKYYPSVINALHSGTECATCGMRFKEIQSEQYRSHLDWHFRRNHREKDRAKKPFSRRLFYEIKDWIQFKEFEDVDERAPSYFELQANDEQAGESSPEVVSSVSCCQSESENCAVCGEQFQLFWVEEEEEWHLKNAVQHNDQVYHPACYEDFEKANKPVTMDPDSSFEETKIDIKTEVEETDSDQVPLNIKEENIDDGKEMKQKNDEGKKIKQEKVDEEKEIKQNVDEERNITKVKDINKTEEMEVDNVEEVKTMSKYIDSNVKRNDDEIEIRENESSAVEENTKDYKITENNVESENIIEIFDIKNKRTEENVKEMEEKKVENEDIVLEIQMEENIVLEEEMEEDKVLEIKENKILEIEMKEDKELEVEKMEEDEVSGETKENKESEVEMNKVDIVIKDELMDSEDESHNLVTDANGEVEESEESKIENKESVIKTEPSDEPQIKSESEKTSQNENVPIKLEDDEIEFRPPTPDPRFEVLPPVFKGIEISNLCTIM